MQTKWIFSLPLCLTAVAALPDLGGRATSSPSKELVKTAKKLPSSHVQDQDISQLVSLIENKASAIDGASVGYGMTKVAQACAIGKIVLPKGYVDPNSGNYTMETEINWSRSCQLPAACVVQPRNTAEVAIAMKIVTLTGTKFAVRSAGHNPNPKFGSIDQSGMLIDISEIKGLKLSDDRKTLRVATGNKIRDIQKFTDQYDFTVVTGVNSAVGSGAILGGGFPAHGAFTGSAADNVENFEVVLSDSTVINANANNHRDLFQVLKGGGNNFGIVTHFTLYTVPIHDLWFNFYDLPFTQYKELLAAIVQVQKNIETDNKASFIAIASGNVWHMALMYVGKSPDSGLPPPFKPLEQFKPIDNEFNLPGTNSTIYKFNEAISAPDPVIYREPLAVTTRPDTDLYISIFEEWLRVFPKANGTGLDLCIKPYSASAVKLSTAHGGDGNIFNLSPVSQTWWSVLAQWKSPADTNNLHNIVVNLVDYMTAKAQASGNYLPFKFPNDASSVQNVVASWGPESVAKMRAASEKYDRAQVFQKLQAGGWLVSKA